MDYKLKISENLKIENMSKEEIYSLLSPSINIQMGDYSLPCFSLSKVLRKSPVLIAESIASSINKISFIEKVQAVNGYVNFYLNRTEIIKDVLENVLSKGETFAQTLVGNNKTIVLDYSSVNIAKQMHIGHLYTTAIGNSLNQIYKYLGYKTVGLNYLGDYGTQFGDIIAAHKLWGSQKELDEKGIDYVQEMYKRAREEKETSVDFENLGREWFKKIEDKNKEALSIFEQIKKLTLNEAMPIFELLNIKFDEWKGELYYSNKMDNVITELKEKGLLELSQGAQIVNLEQERLGVALILKSDGSSIYTTRDLAAAIDRYNTYHFDKCLYVTAYEQNLHFAQFFKVLEKMGYPFAKNLVHVSYGRVSLPEGKLRSRDGAKALLKDIFAGAITRAQEIIEAKNPKLKNKNEVAKAVGVGAVMFGALSSLKIKDTIFDMEEALSFEGETAPYMQYTYARCSSVLKKYKEQKRNFVLADYTQILSDEAFEVIKAINTLNQTILDAADKYEPSILSRALMNISKNFNKFYHDYKILDDNKAVTKARINLVIAVRTTLKLGLNLLGISTIEEM